MYLAFNTTITFYTVILLEFCFRVCSTLHHRSSNSDQRFLLLSDCDCGLQHHLHKANLQAAKLRFSIILV